MKEHITDKVFDNLKQAVKQLGGLINPWLWLAVLAVVYIGQTLTVQIFLWIMVIISGLVVWYPKIKKMIDNNRTSEYDGNTNS
jgi:hypothetical protein